MRALVNTTKIKRERQNEEQDGSVDGGFAQHVRRVGAKRGFSHSAPHCGTESAVILRLLHQHNEDEENRCHDQNERENTEENVHEKGSKHQSRGSFVNNRQSHGYLEVASSDAGQRVRARSEWHDPGKHRCAASAPPTDREGNRAGCAAG